MLRALRVEHASFAFSEESDEKICDEGRTKEIGSSGIVENNSMRFRFGPSRLKWLALLFAIFLLELCRNHAANAQTADCWIDAQTGQSVPTVPIGSANFTVGEETPSDVTIDQFNRNRATSIRTGRTFIRQGDGSWIDAQTGQSVPT